MRCSRPLSLTLGPGMVDGAVGDGVRTDGGRTDGGRTDGGRTVPLSFKSIQ